jgi:hypothetical protein
MGCGGLTITIAFSSSSDLLSCPYRATNQGDLHESTLAILSIKPNSIHDKETLQRYSDEFIYLEGIDFIKRIKSGAPFSETSPMLSDISAVGDWGKICSGLMKLFQGEVLFKFPVVQHLLFGSILSAREWGNKNENESENEIGHA